MAPTTIGRYDITGELGKGGMAIAYKARDPYMKRDVVIKVMLHEKSKDPSFKESFEREAQVLAHLEHPCIVPVYDFGYIEEGPYLVMRLMTGGSLEDQLAEIGQMPLADVARITERIAQGLDHIHSKNIVHRDLKPGNILRDENGELFLADFGLVKLVGHSGSLSAKFILGTPAYMSPEQMSGDVEVDGRTDVYALGIMIYELLAAKLPFSDPDSTRLMMKHLLDPVPSISQLRPDLPPAVDAILLKALAKSPADRYQTAGELAEALIGASSGIPSRRARRRLNASDFDDVMSKLGDSEDHD
jgi:serine/threonine-protein kinase